MLCILFSDRDLWLSLEYLHKIMHISYTSSSANGASSIALALCTFNHFWILTVFGFIEIFFFQTNNLLIKQKEWNKMLKGRPYLLTICYSYIIVLLVRQIEANSLNGNDLVYNLNKALDQSSSYSSSQPDLSKYCVCLLINFPSSNFQYFKILTRLLRWNFHYKQWDPTGRLFEGSTNLWGNQRAKEHKNYHRVLVQVLWQVERAYPVVLRRLWSLLSVWYFQVQQNRVSKMNLKLFN